MSDKAIAMMRRKSPPPQNIFWVKEIFLKEDVYHFLKWEIEILFYFSTRYGVLHVVYQISKQIKAVMKSWPFVVLFALFGNVLEKFGNAINVIELI